MNRIKQAIIFGVMIAFSLLILPVSAQNELKVASIIIEEIDKSDFPEVVVNFRAVDSENSVVNGLNGSSIEVFESGRLIDDLTLAEVETTPFVLAIIIDNGRFGNINQFSTIRPNLDKLVTQGIFREGIDTVTLYKSNGTNGEPEQVLDYTNDGLDFRNAVKAINLDPGPGTAQTIATIQRVIDDFNGIDNASTSHLAILYIGRSFEGSVQSRLTEQSDAVGQILLDSGIQFHAIHTESDLGEQMEMLAATTGGEYVPYLRGQETGTLFDAIYDEIDRQSLGYEMTFRSKLPDTNAREIEISAGDASAIDSYEVAVKPVKIAITSPVPDKVFRRNLTKTDDSIVGDLNIIPVEAKQQDWPDGYERNIVTAELLVDGLSVQKIENPDSSIYQFTVDISDFNDTTTLPVVFRVEDELGLQSVSPSINITIDAVEVTSDEVAVASDATVAADGSSAENSAVSPETTDANSQSQVPTQIVVSPCAEFAFSSGCFQTYMPWLMSAMLAIALIVLSYRYRSQVVSVVPAPIRQVARDVRKTILGGGGFSGETPLAKIYVDMARQDLIGQSIDIFAQTTTFGRDPKLCDIQLYQEDTRSSVSSQHCTLQFDPLQEIFLLTDDNSSAGTRVNDQRIAANDPIRLNDGDIIIMGDMFRQGAKLRFEQIEMTGFEEEPISHSIEEDNRSTILDDDEDFNLFDPQPTPVEIDGMVAENPQEEVAVVEETPAKNYEIDDGKTVLDFGSAEDYEEFPAFDADNSDDDWLSELE